MDEKEFLKLPANQRDWVMYQMLSTRSKALAKTEGIVDDIIEKVDPKGETTVEETVTGKVVIVSDKAVLIGNNDRVAWFPKSTILNLDKIVLEQGKIVELKIVDWFKYKIEWKVPTI
jgi:hypothetical protein